MQEKIKEIEHSKDEIKKLMQNTIGAIAVMLFMVIFIFGFDKDSGIILNEGLSRLHLSKYGAYIILILLLFVLYFLDKIKKIQEVLMEAIETSRQLESAHKIVEMYRINQHEFLNQLQVISGFIQLKKPEMALDYIKGYNIRFRNNLNVSHLARMDVAAILITKMTSELGETIDFKISIHDDLKHLAFTPSETVTVLGNLLQNAMEEVHKFSETERKIEIDFFAKEKGSGFTVSNRGKIPEEILAKIFEQGFTTKDGKNSGVGLFLVSKTVQKRKGSLRVWNGDDQVHFQVWIPDPPGES
ncbi:GHKL domain-containing protein [Heliobacterium chlorum]|uniref:GHKL domain-containing protein n=1 Tax=Heliobacterium chlorum TaxID=2698 RepID=A0ABR7T667_HELCL|nr:GHKL domain-containing protein [Heliobacterium chlorum]MBC9785455.1 GHKL domain-containing protein [Heliobacterium chlorum]